MSRWTSEQKREGWVLSTCTVCGIYVGFERPMTDGDPCPRCERRAARRRGITNIYIALDGSMSAVRNVSQAKIVVGRHEAAQYRYHGWQVDLVTGQPDEIKAQLLDTIKEIDAAILKDRAVAAKGSSRV